MANVKKVSIKIDTGFYKEIGRSNTKVDNAFKEFIDNSTTSFEDHRAELLQMREDRCKVQIKWDDEKIEIIDNAFGMTEEEFGRALRLNAKADSYSAISRGQYGMGLKYAASSLGDEYTIESTALGKTEMYKATMDMDELVKTHPDEIDMTISYADISKHGTRITIKKLHQGFSSFNTGKKSQKLDQLIKQLSLYYTNDIKMNRLELVINDRKVNQYLPEYYIDKNTGLEKIVPFSNEFVYEGKIYAYNGFVGMLNEGSTKGGTGFNMMQKDRGIVVDYMPPELFGQGNDYRRQRVYGEIKLEGDNWIVSFTKSQIKWSDNGLEDAFIDSVKQLKEVMAIFDFAQKFRKKSENINDKDVQKMDLVDTFSGKKESEKPSKPESKPKEETKKPTETSPQPVVPVKEEKKPDVIKPATESNTKEENDEALKVTIDDKVYRFHIIPSDENDMNTKLYKLAKCGDEEDEYNIYINVRMPMFKKYNKNSEKELITKIAISLAITQLSAKSIGLKSTQSQLFIDKFNEILNKE